MPEPQQTDIVSEARGWLKKITLTPWRYHTRGGFVTGPGIGTTVAQTWDKTEADFENAKVNGTFIARAPGLLRQLADEVERLREQWNTRFNTLCGLCGKRYLGPRDEHLHGFGRCDKKVSNDN